MPRVKLPLLSLIVLMCCLPACHMDIMRSPTYDLDLGAVNLSALTGVVKSASGGGIGGAKVTVLDGLDAGRTATTNASGAYRLESLAVGNANLSATADGYRETRAGVYINYSNTLDFILQPL